MAAEAAGQAVRNQEILEQKLDDTTVAIRTVQSGVTSLEDAQKGDSLCKILNYRS